jgi:serine protease Do
MSRTKLPQTLVVACALAFGATEASAQPMAPIPPKPTGTQAPAGPKTPAPAPPAKPASPNKSFPAGPPPQPPARAVPDPVPVGAGNPVEPGVVAILRNGQPAAFGLVLGGDGRIVASRTGLGGNSKNIVVRYADGSTGAANVGHEDRAADLVLLVPQKAAWTTGFVPSNRALESGPLTIYEIHGKQVGRKVANATGTTGANHFDVDVSGPAFLGSPAVDRTGQAAGLIVASCDVAADPKCKPKTRLATVAAMRAFLRTLPTAAAIPTTFLGVRGERAVGNFARGVRVIEVVPGSPAAQANLAAGPDGDLVLAIGGRPVTTPDELTSAIRAHAPGEKVAMTLFSKGAYRQVDVVLAKSTGTAAAAPAPKPGPPPAGSPTGAPRDFKGPR